MDNPAVKLSRNEHLIFFGDSLTRRGSRRNGFIQLIRKAFAGAPETRMIRITEAGVSGNRVPDLEARLDRDVLAWNPTLVVIWIGINDVWHSLSGGGTPEPLYEAGLHRLLTRIRETGSRILLCTPSVIGEKRQGSNPLDGLLDRYTAISHDVAASLSVPVLDLRRCFCEHLTKVNPGNAEKKVLTLDGVHLNDRGNQFLADCMMTIFQVA